MTKNKNILAITGDLGYGGFDRITKDFPDRFINFGAAEFSMLNFACGIALKNKIPIVYSISSFILRRGYEVLKIYIDNENIPVKLVGSGRGKDYLKDNITHWSEDAKYILDGFPNIKQYWPQKKEEINEEYIQEFLYNNKPSFLSLKR